MRNAVNDSGESFNLPISPHISPYLRRVVQAGALSGPLRAHDAGADLGRSRVISGNLGSSRARDSQELTRLPAAPPLVVALEGGYHGHSVGACCAAVLRVLLGEEAAPLPHSPPTSRGEKALPISPHISPHLPISPAARRRCCRHSRSPPPPCTSCSL